LNIKIFIGDGVEDRQPCSLINREF